MSYVSKFVAALVVIVLMGIVASRQLFLFVSRDASGAASGSGHLWRAMIAGSMFCVAGGLMLRFFNRQQKNKWSKVEMTPTGPLLIDIGDPPTTERPPPPPFDALRWTSRRWFPEGQADDRMPMDGSVADSGETPPGQRAFARRTHQLMFKKWSQARHD